MTKKRRTFASLTGLLLLGSMAYCSYNFVSAEKRIKGLCSKITQGLTIAELRMFTSKNRLGPEPKESGISFIVERKTFGRWGCKVELVNGVVVSSEYVYAD